MGIETFLQLLNVGIPNEYYLTFNCSCIIYKVAMEINLNKNMMFSKGYTFRH